MGGSLLTAGDVAELLGVPEELGLRAVAGGPHPDRDAGALPAATGARAIEAWVAPARVAAAAPGLLPARGVAVPTNRCRAGQ